MRGVIFVRAGKPYRLVEFVGVLVCGAQSKANEGCLAAVKQVLNEQFGPASTAWREAALETVMPLEQRPSMTNFTPGPLSVG